MNADLGKSDFSEEEMDHLRDEVKRIRAEEKLSWGDINHQSNIAKSTLSSWTDDKYAGDNEAIAQKVQLWLDARDEQAEMQELMPAEPVFMPTQTAKSILSRLKYAQILGDFALISGGPGLGKTSAIKQYAASRPRVTVATMAPTTKSINAMLSCIVDAMDGSLLASSTTKLGHRVRKSIGDGKGALLIIDEAQQLSELAIEELRAIHDQTGIGLALVGNAEIYTRLDGAARQANFAQVTSRIGVKFNQNRPTRKDVEIILDGMGVDNKPSRQFLHKVAQKPGALRAVCKCVNVARIIANGQGREMEYRDLKSGWASLGHDPVLGG
jgi:DNA transposition AAA+ family ATPase